MMLGPWQLAIILAIVLLLFGARFAQVGKGLGEGIKNFKDALAGKGDGDKLSKEKQS